MAHIPVFTHVPEVPRCPDDDFTSANQWAFRCLMFYAAPLHYSPPGCGNRWAIRLAQVHIKCGEWRFLFIRLCHDAEGKMTGIGVALRRPLPDEFVAELKFWTTPFYECNADPEKTERVEYTHHELMRHLRDPGVQGQLLMKDVGAPAGTLPFWRNLVKFLVDLRIIAPGSIQTYDTMIPTRFIQSSFLRHAL